MAVERVRPNQLIERYPAVPDPVNPESVTGFVWPGARPRGRIHRHKGVFSFLPDREGQVSLPQGKPRSREYRDFGHERGLPCPGIVPGFRTRFRREDVTRAFLGTASVRTQLPG